MAAAVEAGKKAPAFSLPDQHGTTIRLKDLKGKPIVLYFYPKDDTPGCTKEACDFRDHDTAIKKTGAVVLGVSLDDEAAHQKFIAKYSLPFTLLCDRDAKIAKAYGVYKQKSMYGKKYWGIERSTFVINKTGVVAMAFRKVTVEGHAQEVLSALKAL
ncbi:MAG: thioredoxin-dependent thiol peroxidase [Nitrospira sp.]|nr:thioredoxin-dependent thiol peroxidase [Nitrospira sp.]